MNITPEQLEAYWAANPQALNTAVTANPSAFGLSSGMLSGSSWSSYSPTTNGMGNDGYQTAAPSQPAQTQTTQTTQSQPAQTGLGAGITDEALEAYWAQNPDALALAAQQNPEAFLSGGLKQNYDLYSGYETSLQNQANTTGVDPAKFVQDLRMSEDLAYVPGSGSGGEASQERFTDAYRDSINLIEKSGLPLVNEQGLGLNTGFVYTDGDFIFKPGDGPVGEYNVSPESRGSDVGNFMLNTGIPLILAGAGGAAFAPASGAAGAAGTGTAATGTAGLSGAIASAAQPALLNSAIQLATTGSIDPLQAALAGTTPIVDGMFSSMGGGFLQGAATGATMEGIRGAVTGDFDIGDIAKAGLVGGAQASAVDYIRDTLQTSEFSPENVAQLEADIKTFEDMTPQQAQAMMQNNPVQYARLEGAYQLAQNAASGIGPTTEQMASLYQTSDAGKLFGPQGLLGGEYLGTGWLESGINAVGGVLDPALDWLSNPNIAGMELSPGALNAYQQALSGVGNAAALGAEGLSWLITGETPKEPNLERYPEGTVNDLGTDLSGQLVDPQGLKDYVFSASQDHRYDERFNDFEAPRSEDAPEFPGVYEQNPYLPNITPTTPPATSTGTQSTQATQPTSQGTEQEQALPSITNQALLDYWEKNPDKLEQAVQENPAAFGITSNEQTVEAGLTFEQQLENLWQREPDKLAQAIEENPEAFGMAEDTEPAEAVEEEEEQEQIEEEEEGLELSLGAEDDLIDVSEDPLAGVVEQTEDIVEPIEDTVEQTEEIIESAEEEIQLPEDEISEQEDELPEQDSEETVPEQDEVTQFEDEVPVEEEDILDIDEDEVQAEEEDILGADEDEIIPGEEDLPPGSEGGFEDDLPDNEEDLPPGGGGGGGPGVELASGASKGNFNEFMSGITYILPVLERLNIPLEDYISMWIKENK